MMIMILLELSARTKISPAVHYATEDNITVKTGNQIGF